MLHVHASFINVGEAKINILQILKHHGLLYFSVG